MKKIALIEFNFNPPTSWHKFIIGKIVNEYKFDKVIFITSFASFETIDIERISFKNKKNMLKSLISKHASVKMDVIEKTQNQRIEDFIMKFKQSNPNDNLFYISGMGKYLELIQDENLQQLKNMIKFIIIGKVDNQFIFYDDRATMEISNEIDFQEIRNKLFIELKWEDLYEETSKYISDNYLYLKTLAFNQLSPKRYTHTLSVATHAKRLAKINRVNSLDAYNAALIHDVFKEKNTGYLVDLINQNSNYPIPNDKNCLHAVASSAWFKNVYGINNKSIISAVYKHTTASSKMSKMDKILFVADKISNDRNGEYINKVRKLAYKNLDLTFKKLLKMRYDYLIKNNIKVDNDTIEAIEKYCS